MWVDGVSYCIKFVFIFKGDIFIRVNFDMFVWWYVGCRDFWEEGWLSFFYKSVGDLVVGEDVGLWLGWGRWVGRIIKVLGEVKDLRCESLEFGVIYRWWVVIWIFFYLWISVRSGFVVYKVVGRFGLDIW